MMENTLGTAIVTFFACFLVMPLLGWLVRSFGVYAVVEERQCRVYVLFGKVVAVLDEPGLHILWFKLGWKALIVHWLGRCHVLDMRLDQRYLRSQAVNSEEGAPMGIGIWYEMFVSDPVAYLFKNTDPQGSLAANVSSAVVRCLSNMPLGEMLENRHHMSQTVRAEVSPKSQEWGYSVGSTYIRKVHFRDAGMIRQIEEKVVNQLRQVTASIQQEGRNQVSVIKSTAQREAAVELARAAAVRPAIVGAAMQKISDDPEISRVMFEILENERLLGNGTAITLVPPGHEVLTQMLASREGGARPTAAPAAPIAHPVGKA